MKILFKLVFSLVTLLSITAAWAPIRSQSATESAIGARKNSAEKSVVKITRTELFEIKGKKFGYSKVGSGMYVTHKNKYFALTNAHVCVGQRTEKSLSDFTIAFNSDTEQREGILYNFKDMVISTEHDVCFIPLDFIPVSSYDLSNSQLYLSIGEYTRPSVTEFITNFKYYENFLATGKDHWLMRDLGDVVRKNNDQAITLTYNHGNWDKERFIGDLLDLRGNFIGSKTNANIKIASNSKKTKVHPYSLQYSFPTIPGDSGSPVFDTKYNLIGVIFGNTILDEEKSIQATHGLMVPIREAVALIK